MHYHQNRLKWWLRNNATFLIIVAVICAIVAIIFGMATHSFVRRKSMEAVLDKDLTAIHKRTGITDTDVQKLKKIDPNFNWEGTWDRQRWLRGNEQERDTRRIEKARQSSQLKKKERLRQFEARQDKTRLLQ